MNKLPFETIKREPLITSNNIVEIECQTSSGLPHILIHSHPKTALEGKFSLEFCVAIALVDGEVSLKQFTDDKVKGSAVQELMKKIKYVHPPEMGTELVNLRGKLVVKLKSGKIYSRRVDIARGDPRNPLSRDELINKYRDCVRLSLSAEEALPIPL